MNDSSAERNPVERLAEEFAERHRRGERPALTEYTAKYPQHAEEIRDLFPALVMMEQFKPATGATGDYAPAPETAPLERLGDYRILREVGRGGMGVVYEAEQVSLGRHVALKVLPCQALSHPTFRERFQREARAAARLHHTNIVPVFGVGECDGVRYYAMQFIQGEGLDKVLGDLRQLRDRQGALPGGVVPTETLAPASVVPGLLTGQFAQARAEEDSPAAGPEGSPPSASVSAASARPGSTFPGGRSDWEYCRSVARIGLQVAEALAYAHKQGIVHRDIKPSNLLLDQQGTVWVTDFGLAKAEGTDDLTHTGDIVGTLHFMAPERFSGQTLPQSDLYSLGLTLYELLTLRPAFEDTDRARLIERVLHEPPPAPRKLDRRIPRDLETIILKAMAKDPAERYSSAEALAADLRRFLADRPIQARRTPWHERMWRWCRRNPVVAGLLGVVAAVLLLGTAISSYFALQATNRAEQAEQAQREAEQAVREGKKQLLAALLAEARAQRFSRRVGQRFASLTALKKAVALARELQMPPQIFDELRNEAIACLALPDLRLAKEWDGWPDGSWRAGFDGTLQRYARSDRQGAVSIRRVADDAQIAHLPGPGPCEAWPILSPDGRFLAVLYSPPGGFKLWKLEGARPVLLLEEMKVGDIVAFSPDSRQFAFGTRNGSIHLVELPSGQRRSLLAGGPVPSNLAFDPRHQRLAITSGKEIQVRDLDSGKVLAQMEQPVGTNHVAWHPDGNTLAVAGNDDKIHLWNVTTGKPGWVLEGHTNGGLGFTFNHAGNLLASTSWDNTLRLWDPHTGKQLFSKPYVRGGNLRFSPDDRLLGGEINGSKMQLWEIADGRVYRTLVRGPGSGKPKYLRQALHPNGRLLAVAMYDGIGFWDLTSGRELAFQPLGRVGSVLFEPSGALLSYGDVGLYRWPVKSEPASAGLLRVGPPQRLPVPGRFSQIAQSRDGRVLAAAAQFPGAVVLHSDRPGQRVRLGPHEDVQSIAVSPEGQWVATGSFHGTKVKIWEASSGKLVATLPVEGGSGVSFSPDGKWLMTGWDGARLWAVGSWKEGLRIGGGGSFSPDSTLLAVETGSGVVRLVDPNTGRAYARLEDPNHDRSGMGFSRDGTQLICPNNDSQSIHIWDLRLIRAQLVELDLDWDLPPYPPAPKGLPEVPLQVEINDGGLSEIARKKAAAVLQNNEAWLLVTGPGQKRDPARALKLIEQALQDDPDEPFYLNTLGVAQYRNGQYKQALATLEKSLVASKGKSDAFDLFFLAMCHAKLSDPGRAKACFDRAVTWWDGRTGLPAQWVAELNAFRAEAQACLQAK
jgi:WD40 repeat protein